MRSRAGPARLAPEAWTQLCVRFWREAPAVSHPLGLKRSPQLALHQHTELDKAASLRARPAGGMKTSCREEHTVPSRLPQAHLRHPSATLLDPAICCLPPAINSQLAAVATPPPRLAVMRACPDPLLCLLLARRWCEHHSRASFCPSPLPHVLRQHSAHQRDGRRALRPHPATSARQSVGCEHGRTPCHSLVTPLIPRRPRPNRRPTNMPKSCSLGQPLASHWPDFRAAPTSCDTHAHAHTHGWQVCGGHVPVSERTHVPHVPHVPVSERTHTNAAACPVPTATICRTRRPCCTARSAKTPPPGPPRAQAPAARPPRAPAAQTAPRCRCCSAT